MPEQQWQAKWIWTADGGESRNEWVIFRKSFRLPDGPRRDARLRLTADSRYVLYVNGQLVGRGNSRSWPAEQLYDTYEIGHLLRQNEKNVIAVLAIHYGLSTFNYIRGRGGLLAQLDWAEVQGAAPDGLRTDASWRTKRYGAQDPRAPRMCPQLGFVERIDARDEDERWTGTDFADADWQNAVELGPAGMRPWTSLKKRDIPHLTEEAVYPSRVESLRHTRTFQWSTVIDVRDLMAPESVDHANRISFAGLLATVIRCAEATDAVLGFSNTSNGFGRVWIDGELQSDDRFAGRHPEKYLSLKLGKGDHLFVADVTTIASHNNGFRMGVYADGPFELESPLPRSSSEADRSPFVAIGPFAKAEHIDHQPAVSISPHIDRYVNAGEIASTEWFRSNPGAAREVPLSLMSREDLFGLSVWQKEAKSRSVPGALHKMALAGPEPAEIPLLAGYDTEIVIDFGKQLSGFLAFEAEAPEGAIIDLYGYEFQYADGERQNTHGVDNTVRYICRQGRQTFVSHVRRGLRYLVLTVRGAAAPVAIHRVYMNQSSYPAPEIGAFESSDALLNDIWQISRHTTKLCMEDTFVDCPAYEQVYWVGDSRNEALVANYVYGADELVRRSLRLVPGSREWTPLFMNQVPSGWNSVIPNWTFFWAIACQEHYVRTGDAEFAAELWPHVRFTLKHYLTHLNADGVLAIQAWNLLDWAPIDQPDDGIVTHQNCFLALALTRAAQLGRAAGDSAGAAAFESAAERLRIAINRRLWSDEREAYLDCIHADGRRSNIFSMQTQVVAWLTGMAQGERKERLERLLRNAPEGFVPIGSPFMSFFYYEALSGIGAYEQMLDDIRRNYGMMIRHGATTCWEMYPNYWGSQSGNPLLTRSHCHAWSAAPGYFLGAYVLGVTPKEPGWRTLTVAPQPCGLTWARGSVPCPGEGRIDVDWQADYEEMRIRIVVTAPKGVDVTVVVPQGFRGDSKVRTLDM
ncbi:family 78 glycoside hydrolase catalytic domain [Paenibacillaceae bacterium WGS1546]|uniref:family 78 glycoside hydrolase catalytic domain n=1 Tax=Cohnella sp. WGS1546 TaxID=3366810 RepID=UPI00372D86B2